MKFIATSALAVLIVLPPSPLQAAEGVLIMEKSVTGITTRTSQIQIEKDRMRAEIAGATGDTQIVVFDGPGQVMRIINNERKSYTELTKADADKMGAQVTSAMAGMKEKMESLPPAQRAQMEAMMARMGRAGLGGAPVKTVYRRAGSDKVGKWTCDKYEGFQGELKVSEVCTVEPTTLGFVAADFEISKQVATFFQSLSAQGPNQMFGIGTLETQGFSGLPVRRITYRDGKVGTTSELIEVKRQTFDAATYEVPAGYQKQTMGRGPR